MNPKNKVQSKLSEIQIDQIVIAQAVDEAAWEAPLSVRRTKPTVLAIPTELAARMSFLVHLHRKANLAEWLLPILQERVELEEAVFARVKQDLLTNQRTKSVTT